MTREDALDALEAEILMKWEEAKASFLRTKSGATSDQVKQESKYDTRGLEESYLAHGLAKAVGEYETALSHLNQCRLASLSSMVSLGSLVECVDASGDHVYFLLSSSGGGIEAQVDDCEITIITPESPLAKGLLGKEVGERLATPPFKITGIS